MSNDITSSAFTHPDKDTLIEGIKLYSGIKGKENLSARLSAGIYRATRSVLDSVDPASIIKSETIRGINKNSIYGGNISIESEKISSIASLMSLPIIIYVMALTLGAEFDCLLKRHMKRSLSDSLLIDAAGSFIVECYAKQIRKQWMSELNEKGLQVSERFSPGYCDWDLNKGQAAILGFLNLSKIGVRVLSSSVMTPIKTITGIFMAAEIMPEKAPCASCSKINCGYRR